jgi:hypothetical protein
MKRDIDLQTVKNVLDMSAREAYQALQQDKTTVFWVDWREEDDAIVRYCESVLQTGNLAAEVVNDETGEGSALSIRYDAKNIKVPLSDSPDDRHIAICALNDALSPDYEVRFCIDSNGSDTLAFVPLPQTTWRELEEEHGQKLNKHFYQIAITPNLFTGQLPSEWP